MKPLSTKSRLLFCILIIAAFFIPAYHNISALGFISLAFQEADKHADITFIDVLILITPLVFIPVTALVIMIRSVTYVPIRKTIIVLPFLLLVFFLAILSFSGNSNSYNLFASTILLNMQVGFYLAGAASLLLIFTKNHSRRHKRKRSRPQTEVVASQPVL